MDSVSGFFSSDNFRASGLGWEFQVSGLGSRFALHSGFGISGLGFRASGLGFWVSDIGQASEICLFFLMCVAQDLKSGFGVGILDLRCGFGFKS